MARKNTAEELWVAVSEAGMIVDEESPTETALSAAATPGDASISVDSETGYTEGDLIRIGSGDKVEVGEVEGTSSGQIDLVSAVLIDHGVDEEVVSQEKINLGDVSEDGITRETTVDRQEFRVATKAGIYAVLIVSAGARLGWNLVNHSPENVLVALGIPESELTGAGSVADPTVAHADPDSFNTIVNASLYFTGALRDGTTFEIRGMGADFDPNQTMTYARGNPALLPIAADVQRVVYYTPIS